MLVPNDWYGPIPYKNAVSMPIEWTNLQENIFLVPVDETRLKVTGNDKSSPVTVDSENDLNSDIDPGKIHFEVPVGFKISGFSERCTRVLVTITGILMGAKRYRYLLFSCDRVGVGQVYIPSLNLLGVPNFGAINHPKHGIYTNHNVEIDINPIYGASFLYSNWLAGRRDNYKGFPGEAYTELARFVSPYEPNEYLGVSSVESTSMYAVWANRTSVKVYGLFKGGRK